MFNYPIPTLYDNDMAIPSTAIKRVLVEYIIGVFLYHPPQTTKIQIII